MEKFVLLATPVWVNLLILVPILLYPYWRKKKLDISNRTLLLTGVFGIAFGFIEAACVIYLRAATGLLPGYEGTIMDVWRLSDEIYYNQELLQKNLPVSLLTVEIIRELGTGVMIISTALIAVKKLKEQVAISLWIFAFWDIFFYVFLYLTVRWPQSPTTPDVLFLIPEPWFSQVWFPILVSSLTILAIVLNIRKSNSSYG